MHLMRYISTALIVAAAALAMPLTKRRVPNEDAVLANLEGLPACFVSSHSPNSAGRTPDLLTLSQGKCYVSEQGWSPYDFWAGIKGYCKHPTAPDGFWMGDHMVQCAEQSCSDIPNPRECESGSPNTECRCGRTLQNLIISLQWLFYGRKRIVPERCDFFVFRRSATVCGIQRRR